VEKKQQIEIDERQLEISLATVNGSIFSIL